MKTELQIRTTQECPDCKGSGEIGNPEYVEQRAAQDEWEKANGYDKNSRGKNFDYEAFRKAEVEWDNAYWLSKGYTKMVGQFVQGPWDVAECENCGGSGAEVRHKWVDAEEFVNQQLAASFRRTAE